MFLVVAFTSCGPTDGKRYTDIKGDVGIEAILPSGANIGWTKEDLEKHAFVAPTNALSGQVTWTPIVHGEQLSALEYRQAETGGSILFLTEDRSLLRSMTLTFFDRGPVRFRMRVEGEIVAEFENTMGMGFGKGGYILRLSTQDRGEARGLLRQIRKP